MINASYGLCRKHGGVLGSIILLSTTSSSRRCARPGRSCKRRRDEGIQTGSMMWRRKEREECSGAAKERGRLAIADDDILQLARWACLIEDHYSAKRGRTDADGHRVGERRSYRWTVHPPGAARNRAIPSRLDVMETYGSEPAAPCMVRRSVSGKDRRRPGARHQQRPAPRSFCRR